VTCFSRCSAARNERDRLRSLCEDLWSQIGEAKSSRARHREQLFERRHQAQELASSQTELTAAQTKLRQLTRKKAALKAETHRHTTSLADNNKRLIELKVRLEEKTREEEHRESRLRTAAALLASPHPQPR
jgi:chromosome segregation ATPase